MKLCPDRIKVTGEVKNEIALSSSVRETGAVTKQQGCGLESHDLDSSYKLDEFDSSIKKDLQLDFELKTSDSRLPLDAEILESLIPSKDSPLLFKCARILGELTLNSPVYLNQSNSSRKP